VDFAMRRYAKLADKRTADGVHARIVLGQQVDPALVSELGVNSLEVIAFRYAEAVDANDADGQRRASAEMWAILEAPGRGPVEPHELFVLALYGEVVVCQEARDELRHVVAFLAAHANPRARIPGYPRLALLAAPVLGDRALIARTRLSGREAKIADAMEAEMAGERARAARILDDLVKDPTPTWDYPERAALLRDLRALHRDADAKALCAATLEPAIFRYAYLALRGKCR
jgi:hypothetical protein